VSFDQKENSEMELYISALIADDDDSSRKIARYFLDFDSISISEVENGAAVLSTVFKNKIDLIILDWKMPNLTGSETLKLLDIVLKQSESRKKIYVIIYSSFEIEHMILPISSSFKILGYVNKNWSVEIQKRKFSKMLDAFMRKAWRSSAAA
jgi:response regulator RpfG family c-di-GMP phosphodiesterase